LGNRQWDIPKLRQLLSEVTLENKAIDNYEIEHNFEIIGPKTMLFNVRRLTSKQMILITIEDITEYKKAAEALRKSEECYRVTFENTGSATVLIEDDTTIILANTEFERLSGFSKQEIEGKKTWTEFVVKEDLARMLDMHRLRRENREITAKQYEFRFVTRTGSIRDIALRIDVIPGTKRSVAALIDITERKKNEMELKNANAELAGANKVLGVMQQNMQTVIKHSTDGLLIVDDNKIVLFMNLAAEVILGRRAQDLLGEPFGLPLTTDKPSEIQLVAADGSVTIAEVQAVRTEWENGPVYMATIRDITLLKKAQQETEAANEQLRRFNDLKDEFISMASHELRTPLSIISGAVKLLIDEIPGKIVSGQKEILGMAVNNLNRLARIVDSLLNISKIESGKIELYRTDADISRLIAETVIEYSPLAEERHINLSCQLPVHPVILYADADRIKEIIVNLLSNSIKFTPQGGSINVCCEDRNDDVLIFVKDTGRGVAKNDVPRMFEKFMQFNRKVGPGEKGTGLGLAICKGLVTLHNGKIWAESDTGSGMKISFTIPRLSAEHIFTESVDNAVKSSLKTGGGATVILVSTKPLIQMDSPQMQAVLKDISEVLERNLRRNALNTVIQGTNEVLVVLGNCDIAGAASVCQRLTQAIEGHLADKDLGSKLNLLIGYAVYPDDGQAGQSLIEKAREAGVACLPSNKA
jgi:PAS domain S-box-containing protein